MNTFNKGFWSKLKPPILAMAPMANVTDAAFRQMFAECGKPDVFWTEFVSVKDCSQKGRIGSCRIFGTALANIL